MANSKVGRVLRACHQKMIFPGFYYIKNLIQELPFQDQRGTWVVSVHIGVDFVEVKHRKIQSGKPKGIEVSIQAAIPSSPCSQCLPTFLQKGDPEFAFEWELRVRFSRDLEEITKVAVTILELKIAGI